MFFVVRFPGSDKYDMAISTVNWRAEQIHYGFDMNRRRLEKEASGQ